MKILTKRPLTNNEVYAKVKGFEHKYGFCKEEDVLSAVALLKERINDLYHQIGKAEIWRASNDEVADLCEEFVLKLIDECFQIGVKE